MARNFTVDMEVNPIMNVKEFDNGVKQLEKRLRSVKFGRHEQVSDIASNLIQTLVQTGKATTVTQGRQILSSLMGGGFSENAKAILRMGQNKAQVAINTPASVDYSTYTAKRITQLRPEHANIATQWNNILTKYLQEKEEPTQEGTDTLLGNIVAVRRDLVKLFQEYRVNRRIVPQILRQIAQNTSSMKKEVSDWDMGDDSKSQGDSNSSSKILKTLTGKLAGFFGISSLLKKGFDAFKSALDRGNQALRLEAAYGQSVNWGDVRARAGVFNMSTEAAAAPSQYAADFRQRMMWGELSEREIIGLSRAGKWGRMVMSGEAARNPEKANQAFEEMVATTDKAKMRSIIRQVGLPEDLMNYNIQAYDEKTRKEFFDQWNNIASIELDAAKALYDAGNQLQVALEDASKYIVQVVAESDLAVSPQGRAAKARLEANPLWQEEARRREREKMANSPLKEVAFATNKATALLPGAGLTDLFNRIVKPEPVSLVINNNNTNTFNGVSEENGDELANKISESMSRQMYEDAASHIAGAITHI